jgi:3-oxoacyl-[acyl-carrier protein] reductase
MSDNSRVACITGGTSGMGKALTLRLLLEGWTVFAVGRTPRHAAELDREVGDGEKARLHISHADLRDYLACEGVATAIDQTTGKVDLLVNGAGTIGVGGVLAENPDRWDLVISSNLTTAFNMIKTCAELLKRASDSNGESSNIINISSVCSLRPCPSVAYSVSKAGLDMLTKSTAIELAPEIRVNSINPSVVRTNLQKSAGLFSDEESYSEWVAQMRPSHPVGRVGKPDDIVAAILYVISREASWVTGAIFSIDGGRSIA